MLDEGFQSASLTSEIAQSSSYNRAVDLEIGNDLSSGVVFSADFHKFDDLKNLLDSNKDAMKLSAMKRIIEMVARGKDCSDLFPAVVKNVVSKDNEIRKLVYAFLTHYAEQEQDIALLSISTFQRAMKDPNQLVRASALRVLSSIRIPLILPIVTLAIQDASKDLSPYVRKTAAHAVLKVYSLDPNEKETLIEIIDRLLSDKTTVVIGSAVRAFEEVCPDRLDLIHKNYRKLCSLIMDVDEWGQVIILTMLTRYARTQFPNPEEEKYATSINHDNNLTFDDISSMSTPVDGRDVNNGEETSKSNIIVSENLTYSMSEALPLLETDRNMLINASRYLLYSHNSAVVMAASQLLFYLKCKDDYPSVVRALIRTLNCNREVQYIVLSNIASLTIDHRHLFEPYLRVFFIYSTDSLQVKLLKLEILSSLISETSSSIILREFQHYVNSYDEEFVTATIQAIGRCASTVPQISDVCLGGLLRLMSRPKEKIMAECVVVLRKLLQMQTTDHKEIIMHIAQLADTITIPTAVASILWLLGEFSHRVPKIAPDILRKMVKSFSQQEPVVKYQIINLAAKLCIVNPRQTLILAQYVFNLAKYDTNYDIRDKARFLRGLLFPQITTNPNLNGDNVSHGSHKTPMKLNSTFLSKHARKICLASKPAPIIKSQFDDRSNFRLGTLSHILHRRISGYRDLSDWPIIPPDPWSRIIVTSTASKLNDNESLNINSPKSNKMYHNKSIFNDENQLRQQHKKTDRFGNVALNDFFSETEDEEDDEENDDELVDEDQEKSGKVKDTLSSFYTDHDTSNEEFTSDENNEQNNIDDNEDIDDEFDSDLDIQYLLQSKQSTEVIISKDIQSSSSLLLLPSNSLIGNQSDSIPYNNDTLNTMNNISVSEKLQISMKENLISWLNTQSSSASEYDDDDDDDESIEYSNDIEGKILHEDNEKSPGSVPRVGHSTDTLVSVSHSEGCFEIPGAKTDVVSPSSVLNLPKDSTNECVDYPIQIIHSPLLWYNLTNPNVNDLTGQLQYTRLVWNNHSKLIIISLKLVNQNTSTTLTNIHFDLMNTAMGRLLVDAKRIQAFEPIVELKPQSTCIVEFGVDFAGFCDSIDLDLVYEMVSNSLNFEQIKKWPICLTPPPTELIRPIDMNKKDYFIQRDKLISSESFHHHHHHHHHHFKVKDHQSTGNVVSSVDYSSQLISHLLQYINIKYQFNTLYRHSKCICDHFDCHNENLELSQSTASIDLDTSYLSIFLAGQTVADNQLCLIEFAWSPTILLNNNNNNTNMEIISSIFCNSTSIFRKHLSSSIEKIILSW